MRGRLVLFTPGHVEPGGAQRRSAIIAQGLADLGWEVRVVTRAGSMRRPRIARADRLTVIEVPGFGSRRLGGILFMATALPLGLLWGRKATAYLSLQLMSTSIVAAICALLLRRPYLALATTTGELSEIAYLRSTRTWRLRRWLLEHASFLLTQTEEARSPFAAILPDDRIAVLPNPVVVPAEAPALNGSARVAFAGRLTAEKNLFTLLDAWRGVVDQVPGAKLTLLGEGGQFRSVEHELRHRVASDPALRRSVDLPGWVPDPASVVASCDAFVLASREEGMSNALLEACALGRVVIASDIPPNRAVLGDQYPYLVRPDDQAGFRAAMLDALNTESSTRARARKLVRERVIPFAAGSVVRNLEELIDAANSPRS